MKIGFRKFAFVLTPPLMSVALLAGIVAEQRTHLQPQAVEPYHTAARGAVAQVPYVIGYWTGTDEKIPPAAQKLLRPNAILSRLYSDNSPAIVPAAPSDDVRTQQRTAHLLIVQCRDSRDMLGHYPPVCYRSRGDVMEQKNCRPRDWTVNGVTIPGYEYQFTQVQHERTGRIVVYNFLIVPGRGIVRDMKGVEQAAEDYQQRYYGAQFQVVFDCDASSPPPAERLDEVFATLIGPNLKLIETLTSASTTPATPAVASSSSSSPSSGALQ